MPWRRVGLVVAGSHAEALADALEAGGAIATEITDADARTGEAVFAEPGAEPVLWKRSRVQALFPVEADARAALAAALEASGAEPLEAASLDSLADADWVAETQRQFEPFTAGERLWIVPSWSAPPRGAGAIAVVLDPGAAFGTGSHPTTRLCLRWLEANVGSSDVVLDYGCGSGILAIAALKLGAARAIAVDIDPMALETAGYNARRNAVPLELASAAQPLQAQATLTVANILASPLRMLAALLATHTAPGGRIALSGILETQASEVIEAYAPWASLAVAGRDEGWVLVAGTRS